MIRRTMIIDDDKEEDSLVMTMIRTMIMIGRTMLMVGRKLEILKIFKSLEVMNYICKHMFKGAKAEG